MKHAKPIVAVLAGLIMTAAPLNAADMLGNWNKHCVSCHAKDGSGKTVQGRKVGAKDYRDPKVVAEMTDEKAIKAIKEGMKDKAGKELMKPYGDKLNDEEIKALVKHMRSFASEK